MDRRTRTLKDILWVLALGGLVAAVFRLWFGLGATTNLTDGAPWGLWKVLNMVAGVALSTSGFTVGFLVYVLKLEKFRPLMKPAILVAFLGYGSSCVALLFDIGIPYRFWHPFFMWNHHSFLFEVFWCVMLYFCVTTIEVLSPILERYRAERAVKILHKVAFGVVVVGISLSSLHHSSLGSLFLVSPLRLHSLWYSSLLPLFFILSAMGAGMMFVILLRILYARLYDPEPVFGNPERSTQVGPCVTECQTTNVILHADRGRDMPALSSLATIAAVILSLYLGLKVMDLFRTGAWQALLAGTWESWLYTVEILTAAVIPVVLIALSKTRHSPLGLGLAALSATTGLALNRLDVGIAGYWRDAGTTYFPSLLEWVLGLGVVAAAGLVFLGIVENFSIFEKSWGKSLEGGKKFQPSFDAFSRVWNTALSNSLHRVSLIAVFILPVAWLAMYPPYQNHSTDGIPIQPPLGLDAERTTLRIDGNRGGVFTDFPHVAHQQRLGGEVSCVTCHHISLPGDHSTPCSRCHRDLGEPTDLFDHFGHMVAVSIKEKLPGIQPVNHSCEVCHSRGTVKTGTSVKTCYECHQNDMHLADIPPKNLALASGYQSAMHRTCLGCHQQKADNPELAHLPECGTCHPSLRPRETMVARRDALALPGGKHDEAVNIWGTP